MEILQIANKATFPPDGGSLAILSLARGYVKNSHQVYLLNMETPKHFNNPGLLEPEIKDKLLVHGVRVNTHLSMIKLGLNLLFSNKPYIAQRFISSKYTRALKKLISVKSFDIIQVEGLYMLQYIRIIKKNFSKKIIYRPHNIEHKIWERNAQETRSFIKRIYFKNMARRLKKLELSLLNSYDYLLPISPADAEIYTDLGNTKPVCITPFGIDFQKLPTPQPGNPQQNIIFIGALDWIPNQKGITWFIDHCWDKLLETGLQTELLIAGRNAPGWLVDFLTNKPGIKYLGEIDNAHDFMIHNGPLIVPLFSGSGLRVKIIEAMALKKSILSTTIGAEGIPYTDKKNIIIANNADEFIRGIKLLTNEQDTCLKIGEEASKLAAENFDLEKIAHKVLNFIN